MNSEFVYLETAFIIEEFCMNVCLVAAAGEKQSKKISNDQELTQSDAISYPQIQKGNN